MIAGASASGPSLAGSPRYFGARRLRALAVAGSMDIDRLLAVDQAGITESRHRDHTGELALGGPDREIDAIKRHVVRAADIDS
jgi:hypothetical protein